MIKALVKLKRTNNFKGCGKLVECDFLYRSSCSPNPVPCGWAVIEEEKPVATGVQPELTNIQMEAMALIEAMKLMHGEPVRIHTDSEFCINVITKWAPGWEAKG